jgi:hypothetical protein
MSAKGKEVLILDGTGKTGRRAPRDFADYARAAAASGVWSR